jgi:hypothetical protein
MFLQPQRPRSLRLLAAAVCLAYHASAQAQSAFKALTYNVLYESDQIERSIALELVEGPAFQAPTTETGREALVPRQSSA